MALNEIGTLSLVGEPEDVKTKYLHDINIESGTDTRDCFISGIVALPGGRLAVADYYNKCIKLIDVVEKKVSEKVSLMSAPVDLTITGDDQLAVTLDDENHIQFLSLSPTLSVGHTVTVPGCYNGITYNGERLLLTCWNPDASVHICDRSGNLLQQIDSDNAGNELFRAPSRITVSADQRTVYVSDCVSNKIVCLNNEGVVMTTYVSDVLQRPAGLTVDNHGRVYVCSNSTHSVHMLSHDGRLVKILIGEKDGIQSPWAIAYSNGTIYVSGGSTKPSHKNKIKVYGLE